MAAHEATFQEFGVAEERGPTRSRPRSQSSTGSQDRLARGLGWFSIGLGLTEVAMPGKLGKMIGVPGHEKLMRSMGLREIAARVAILSQGKPADWMLTRVGGDVLDLTLLAAAFGSDRARKGRLSAATAAVAGVTLLDVICTRQLTQAVSKDVHVVESIAVNRPAEKCYRFWRDFQRLGTLMAHLESVREMPDGRSHWIAKAPVGMKVEWDAELTQDIPNERIGWRSLENAMIQTAGHVQFERAPGNRGTIIRVSLHYKAPAGEIGALLSKLFGQVPALQIKKDLHLFKQAIETGEIATTEGQPCGRESGLISSSRRQS